MLDFVVQPGLLSSYFSMENDTSTVVTSITTTSGPRRERLPTHLQKQLAIDIEENGGINRFVGNTEDQSLYYLLEQRQDLYGERGDPIRTKIRRRVRYWRDLNNEGKYNKKVLVPFGIVQFDQKLRMKTRNQSSDDISLSSSDHSAEKVPSPPPKKSTPAKSKSNRKKAPPDSPLGAKVEFDRQPSSTPLSPLIASMDKMSLDPKNIKRKKRWEAIAAHASKSTL